MMDRLARLGLLLVRGSWEWTGGLTDNGHHAVSCWNIGYPSEAHFKLKSRSLSGEPDYFGRNKISSGGDLSHYSSASLY